MDVLRQIPISKNGTVVHGRPSSSTYLQNSPAWTPFAKYVFPKCACINTICKVFISKMRLHGRQCCPRTSFVKYLLTEFTRMAVHGHPSSNTYFQNAPAILFKDVLRQAPSSKMNLHVRLRQIPISKMYLHGFQWTSFVTYLGYNRPTSQYLGSKGNP